MDQELFIIELLSSKEQIAERNRYNTRKNSRALLLAAFFCLVFFFGIATLVYHFMEPRIYSLYYSIKLDHLYHFSLIIGGVLIALLLVVAASIYMNNLLLERNFSRWVSKKAKRTLQYTKVYQDSQYYYLAKKFQTKPRVRLRRNEIVELQTTIDGYKIMMGQKPLVAGLSTNQLFILKEEPPRLAEPITLISTNAKWGLILLSCAVIGIIGLNNYSDTELSTYAGDEYYGEDYAWEETQESTATVDSDGLTVQQGEAPNTSLAVTNYLDFNQETNELYMTTDAGQSWSFVPIDPMWLRGGDYMLTIGAPELGYWMDKTFEISPDFSWFIYTEGETGDEEYALKFLQSRDNGQTWQTSVVVDPAAGVRYRKANFFPNGSGVLVYAETNPYGVSEYLKMFVTNDYGASWSPSAGKSTNVIQPVQNVSFVSTMEGFIGTRDHFYYTNNGGVFFNEAVITVPDGYQADGLDLFQSPSEVTQVNSNTYETIFHLLKMGGVDQGKMFACRYRSTDNGMTWQFVQQVAEEDDDSW